VNRDRRGPGFWKLDKANCEAVQKNLTSDFLRLAESHRAEISKLLDFQDTLVERMRKEMEAVAEPIKPAEPAAVASEFEDDDEDDPVEEQEPSLLHVLNED
jgi:leucyl-tRNA synthetase